MCALPSSWKWSWFFNWVVKPDVVIVLMMVGGKFSSMSDTEREMALLVSSVIVDDLLNMPVVAHVMLDGVAPR